MEDSELKDKELLKAVTEYYDWHGESQAIPVSIIRHKKGSFDLLLVHFVAEDGTDRSALLYCQHWADGHYDVEEMEDTYREYESEMVENFANSDEFY